MAMGFDFYRILFSKSTYCYSQARFWNVEKRVTFVCIWLGLCRPDSWESTDYGKFWACSHGEIFGDSAQRLADGWCITRRKATLTRTYVDLPSEDGFLNLNQTSYLISSLTQFYSFGILFLQMRLVVAACSSSRDFSRPTSVTSRCAWASQSNSRAQSRTSDLCTRWRIFY